MKKGIVMMVIVSLAAGMMLASGEMVDFSAQTLKEAFQAVSADSAIGSPIQIGDAWFIPLFEQKVGFGGGSGGVPLMFGFSGGSIELLPYAMLMVSPTETKVLPVSNVKPFFEQVIDALPKIMPIVMDVVGYFMIAQDAYVSEPGIVEREVHIEREKDDRVDTKPLTKEEQVLRLQRMLETDQTKETYEGMVRQIEGLISQYPESAELQALSGQAMMMLGTKSQGLGQLQMAMRAMAAFNNALAMDPENVRAIMGLAWIDLYSPTGNVQNSIAGFEKVLSMQPANLEALIGAAEAYNKAGNKEKAQEMARRGLEIDPGNAQLKAIIQ